MCMVAFWSGSLLAQYDPAAGQKGSLAIAVDSSIIMAWATECEAQVGWQQVNDTSFGKVNNGSTDDVLGKADIITLSLGDGGMATMHFKYAISNGEGPDFAVFENSFLDDFLELAFVEVSSDGKHFVRFPAVSLSDTAQQVDAFGRLDPTKLHNLAGKHRGGFGTPFDLEELVDSPNINLDSITHVRIIDVVGSVNPTYGKRDSKGVMINDPWPTPFPSSGFDLDAVAVIHSRFSNIDARPKLARSIAAYPNPVQQGQMLQFTKPENAASSLQNTQGQSFNSAIAENTIYTETLSPGIYLLSISTENQRYVAKIMVTR